MRAIGCFLLILGATMLASAQNVTAPKSNWLADDVRWNGDVITMRGHVRIATCGVITADDAVGGPNANDTVLSGNVRLRITSAVDPLR